MTTELPSCLYRLRDAEGVLLHAGISDHWGSRMDQHSRRSAWWGEVASVSVAPFATRRDAERAEYAAIVHEGPRYNRSHNPAMRSAPMPKGAYSVEKVAVMLNLSVEEVEVLLDRSDLRGTWVARRTRRVVKRRELRRFTRAASPAAGS